jgi:hypothetical protein
MPVPQCAEKSTEFIHESKLNHGDIEAGGCKNEVVVESKDAQTQENEP